MKLYVTDEGNGKKCGGCNWGIYTYTFYGLGKSKADARAAFDGKEGCGLGLCAQCMCDLIIKEKLEVN